MMLATCLPLGGAAEKWSSETWQLTKVVDVIEMRPKISVVVYEDSRRNKC